MFILSDHLNAVLALDPAADAVEFDGRWFTWGELSGEVAAVRARIDALGLGPDSRIGIMIRNRPASIAAVLAVLSMRACIVTINPLLPAERLLTDLAALRLPVVIGEADDFARDGVVALLQGEGTAGIVMQPFPSGVETHPNLPATGGAAIRRDQPGTFVEMLTSGTTGAPKRIPLKRSSLESAIVAALEMEKGRRADDPPKLRSGIELLGNPITHIGGLYFVITTFASGRKLALQEKFSVAGWRDSIVRHRPKIVGAVPAALRMILEADIPPEDLSSLRAIRSGTAPLDPEIVDEFLRRYDLPVMATYGATEFAGSVAMWRFQDFRERWPEKRGSAGQFFGSIEGRIVDADTGAVLPPGEEGLLELRAAQIGDGKSWVRTTDRGVIDSDNYLFIRGRADNAIIRGGFKVHPDDVNRCYEQYPAVREAVTIGLEDRRLGAVPAIALILRAGAARPTDEDLIAFGKARLMPYQVPTRFLIVDDLPRTPSMKPALQELRALFESSLPAAV